MKKIKGFTLVELVIVIAIVIILSVVSVPIYRGYTKNAKMAEGYALIGTIFSAQKTYYSQYGNFLLDSQTSGKGQGTCNEEVLGIDARGNKYFTLFHTGGSSVNKEHMYISVMKPEELGDNWLTLYYNITSGSTFVDNKSTPR